MVLADDGSVLAEKGAASHALLVAHRLAEQHASDDVAYVVERRMVLGPAAQLYRVVRKCKDVLTFTISTED